MDPWYKVATPRTEVREGRSFNPDEFAIALEQVVAGTAPDDYKKPDQFFARTCFTRALREHAGMVLRRLSGKTDNTAPVLTLITQFGGGKTHTLTTLYHLAKNGESAIAGDLESSRDQDPAETSLRIRSQDRPGLLGHGQNRERRQSRNGAPADPAGTRTGRPSTNRIATLSPTPLSPKTPLALLETSLPHR